jgi:hypothetical protein
MKISAECNICTPMMHKLQIHFAVVTAIDANACIQRGVIYTRRQQQPPFYLAVVGSLRTFLQQIKRRGFTNLQNKTVARASIRHRVDLRIVFFFCWRVCVFASQVPPPPPLCADKWCGNAAIQQCAGGAGAVKN